MEFVITIFISITAALVVCHLVIHGSRSGRLIKKIRGPKGFPIIGNVFAFLIPENELWPLLENWVTIYTPTVKFWILHLPLVFINDPDDIELIATSKKNISKNFVYDYIVTWLNRGLLTSDGKKWHARRKMLTPAFHFNLLHDYVGVFFETAVRMVNTLKEERCEVVDDVISLFSKYTLQTICETTMGMSAERSNPAHEEYRKSVHVFNEIIFHRLARPWLASDWIFSLTSMGRLHARTLKTLHKFTIELIEERKRYHDKTGGQYLNLFSSGDETAERNVPRTTNRGKRLALLDLLIAKNKEHGNIDDLGIREEVDTFIFEGHETTTIAMSFTVLLLAKHKDIQARARAEVDSIMEKSNGQLTMNELQRMVYLDCCVKESLRLYPPVYSIGRRLSEDLHLVSENLVIPSRTNVFTSIWRVHRNPDLWPNPTVFDPDRFLPEKIATRHPYSFLPFSAGPRNCIGQKYAMLELKAFVALLLHNFHFEKMTDLDALHKIPDLTLRIAEPMKVKFVPVR